MHKNPSHRQCLQCCTKRKKTLKILFKCAQEQNVWISNHQNWFVIHAKRVLGDINEIIKTFSHWNWFLAN
jgi:hypothetical protein